ncbi:UNVERIFIED_CONTAM: hypothetical protein FKN15_014652 [Acipenser sinensis]
MFRQFCEGKFAVLMEGVQDEDMEESYDSFNIEKEDLVAAVTMDEDLPTFRELTDEDLLSPAAAARPEEQACVD